MKYRASIAPQRIWPKEQGHEELLPEPKASGLLGAECLSRLVELGAHTDPC